MKYAALLGYGLIGLLIVLGLYVAIGYAIKLAAAEQQKKGDTGAD